MHFYVKQPHLKKNAQFSISHLKGMNLEGDRIERMFLHNLWKMRYEPEHWQGQQKWSRRDLIREQLQELEAVTGGVKMTLRFLYGQLGAQYLTEGGNIGHVNNYYLETLVSCTLNVFPYFRDSECLHQWLFRKTSHQRQCLHYLIFVSYVQDNNCL